MYNSKDSVLHLGRRIDLIEYWWLGGLFGCVAREERVMDWVRCWNELDKTCTFTKENEHTFG